jgi:hypothetical protein
MKQWICKWLARKLDCLVIPQSDIYRLEKARLEIWEIIKFKPVAYQSFFINATSTIWEITHRKY